MALWGKEPVAPETRAAERAPAAVKATPKETPMALGKREEEPVRRGGEANAVLGRGTEFVGKLTFEGEARIAGRFTGEIVSKGRLQVDEGARVQAEIAAGTVVVFGEIVGNIKAGAIVELRASAHVKGNIETPALMIEKGVVFEGSCKMENLGKGASVPPLKPEPDKEKR